MRLFIWNIDLSKAETERLQKELKVSANNWGILGPGDDWRPSFTPGEQVVFLISNELENPPPLDEIKAHCEKAKIVFYPFVVVEDSEQACTHYKKSAIRPWGYIQHPIDGKEVQNLIGDFEDCKITPKESSPSEEELPTDVQSPSMDSGPSRSLQMKFDFVFGVDEKVEVNASESAALEKNISGEEKVLEEKKEDEKEGPEKEDSLSEEEFVEDPTAILEFTSSVIKSPEAKAEEEKAPELIEQGDLAATGEESKEDDLPPIKEEAGPELELDSAFKREEDTDLELSVGDESSLELAPDDGGIQLDLDGPVEADEMPLEKQSFDPERPEELNLLDEDEKDQEMDESLLPPLDEPPRRKPPVEDKHSADIGDESTVLFNTEEIDLKEDSTPEEINDLDLVEEDLTTEIPAVSPKEQDPVSEAPKVESSFSISTEKEREDFKNIAENYDESLLKLQLLVSRLREEKEYWQEKALESEEEKEVLKRENLDLTAHLEEKKIEVEVQRRRMRSKISLMQEELEIDQEKRKVVELALEKTKKDLQATREKFKKHDLKIHEREKNLEGQLELIKADNASQINNRDLRIQELERMNQGLRFDLSYMASKDNGLRKKRFQKEEKLELAMGQLRKTLELLEKEDLENQDLSQIEQTFPRLGEEGGKN